MSIMVDRRIEKSPENIRAAIAVMKRVETRNDLLNMEFWQWLESGWTPIRNETELHECRMPACFGGWLAVSPEFQAAGGKVGPAGEPVFGAGVGVGAIAEFLGIRHGLAESIAAASCTYIDRDPNTGYQTEMSSFYNRPVADIRAGDVIRKLEALL